MRLSESIRLYSIVTTPYMNEYTRNATNVVAPKM